MAYTARVVVVPWSSAKAAACPLRPTGSALVAVHVMVDGLKAAFWLSVKVIALLVPPEVFTTTGPVAAPAGTVVTMKVLLQSPAFAITALTVPPVPLEKSTAPDPWAAPKFCPSITTVLPVGPDGWVAPLTSARTGGPEGPDGPVGPPPHPTRSATPRRNTRVVRPRSRSIPESPIRDSMSVPRPLDVGHALVGG